MQNKHTDANATSAHAKPGEATGPGAARQDSFRVVVTVVTVKGRTSKERLNREEVMEQTKSFNQQQDRVDVEREEHSTRMGSITSSRQTKMGENVLLHKSNKEAYPHIPPPPPHPRTGGGFLHQKNSCQINALPLGLIKLEGIKTTEQLLWWTQCCASCACCSEGNFCHLASVLPAALRRTRSNTVNVL